MFLTLFGQNMNSTDPLETLEQAFSIFDETGSGKIKKADLEFLLKNIGDRYTQQQVRLSDSARGSVTTGPHPTLV